MLFTINPAALPDGYGEALVPLADAKRWLGLAVDEDEFDLLVEALRDAAIDAVEQFANLSMGPRTDMVANFAAFGPAMRPSVGPAASLSVTAVSYIDSDGNTVELEAGDWRVGVDGSLLPPIGSSCWPTSYGPVTVTFDAGYAAGACPAALIMSARMMLAFLWLHRDEVLSEGLEFGVPRGVATLAGPFRMIAI